MAFGTIYVPAVGPKQCKVEECTKPILARQLCNAHWLKWWRYGDPLHISVKAPSNFCRIYKHHTGHLRCWVNGKDTAVARAIMEVHLNRKLSTDEIVHHINEVSTDNRLCNLKVISRDKHTTHHLMVTTHCIVCGKENDGKFARGMCGKHYSRWKRSVSI